jgi:uncharacterized protein YndB with AHSA1/START domain
MPRAHRARTLATPAEVWSILDSPSSWPQFNLTLRRVRGAGGHVAAGQHLLGIGRGTGMRVPVDVLEAVPDRRLVLRVHTAPGVREEVTHELTPAVRGGCDISVSVVVEGLFARPAFVPLWLAAGGTARLLAVRADRLARAARGRGVA